MYRVINSGVFVSHQPTLLDIKVEASFCHVEENWLRIDTTVFDDDFRSVEIRVVCAVCES